MVGSSKLYLATVVLACCWVSGCASWSGLSLKDSRLRTASMNPAPQPSAALADPRNQELAIALETARLAEERGMDQEAIRAFLEARKLNPSQPGIAHSLAVLYDRAGMTDAAQREYEAAIVESPKDANVYCDYGYFLYCTHRLDESETNLRTALRLDSKHQQAMINLGLVIGSQGRYEESERLFQDAIGPAAALHNVGMLKLKNGDVENGKSMIAEASRRDPSIREGRKVLARLDSSP